MVLGLMLMPTAIITKTPLNCQLCKEDNCKFIENGTMVFNASNNPGYDSKWVTKYCTMEAVDQFVQYYPYILIIIPFVLVAIENGFSR